jgi:hypothetical protein
MRKREICALRKEFKDDTYKLNLKDIYSVYINKTTAGVVFTEKDIFATFGIEKKELYFENFKKVLNTAIDTKIFNLDFENGVTNTKDLLYAAIKNKDEFENHLNQVVETICSNYTYDTDIVITFLFVNYLSVGKDEDGEDDVNQYDLLLCSINQVEFPKKNMIFDYKNHKLAPNSVTDVIINLHAPIEGFMYPNIDDGYSDFNRILYYTKNKSSVDGLFVTNVLGCKTKFTSQQEKQCFHSILAAAIGDKVKPELIQEVYLDLTEKVEEDEEHENISKQDIKNVLEYKGIDNSKVDFAFDQVCRDKTEFRAENILPKFNNKSIKISSGTLDINISPTDLSSVKQIRDGDGKKYLKIEITEDMELNGLILETE